MVGRRLEQGHDEHECRLEVGYGVARIRLFRKLTERMNKTR